MTVRDAIALTFDDGPSEWTEPILDLLREHGVRATFFVVGSAAQLQPGLIRRILAEGHELGNHSWSHPDLAADCDDDHVRDELERTNRTLEEIVGMRPQRFRAPHLSVDDRVKSIASELGLTHTPTDVGPPDWHPAMTAAVTTTFILQQVAPGYVVGLHDGMPPHDRAPGQTRQATVDAVRLVLPRLVERYDLVTASRLLQQEA
jgi:peptidoglycan/xylan/chitin deacetylase (PgdA/CDA1 family)